VPQPVADVEPNQAYFTIQIDTDSYGMSRDDLWHALKEFNVITRRYFAPLCSHYSFYASLSSAAPANLPVAERVAEQVLCLPLYGGLESAAVDAVCSIISGLADAR
jgi:dTDP-4-amino-4,6-dideoxygalactose transaminase